MLSPSGKISHNTGVLGFAKFARNKDVKTLSASLYRLWSLRFDQIKRIKSLPIVPKRDAAMIAAFHAKYMRRYALDFFMLNGFSEPPVFHKALEPRKWHSTHPTIHLIVARLLQSKRQAIHAFPVHVILSDLNSQRICQLDERCLQGCLSWFCYLWFQPRKQAIAQICSSGHRAGKSQYLLKVLILLDPTMAF